MRGLVLGGGGITGIAWETGLIAGLAGAGIDLTSADVVVGTSAGAVVGAHILSGSRIGELCEEQLADPTSEERGFHLGLGFFLRVLVASVLPGSERDASRRLGRAALRARTESESEWLADFDKRVGGGSWPNGRLVVAAIDAETGELRQFDERSGVPLVDAVAANCAVPTMAPPITIGGRRYIDAGVRSQANADLATGCDRVVVVAPFPFAVRRRQRIAMQLASLGPGVRTVVVSPTARRDRRSDETPWTRRDDPPRRAPGSRRPPPSHSK